MKRYFALFSFLLIVSISIYPTFGDSELVLAETDKLEYSPGDLLTLSGFVLQRTMPEIAINVYDPDNTILAALKTDILDDDSFSKTISLDPVFYGKDGIYTIKMNYGKVVSNVDFIVVNSDSPLNTVPEPTVSQLIEPKIVSLTTSKPEYHDNDTIIISGTVSAIDSTTNSKSVLVGIYDTFGNPAGFYFGNIDENLKFSVSFLAKSGINFKKDGTYSVSAHYAESNSKITFQFVSNSVATPVDTTPVDTTPVDTTPVDTTPVDTTPVDTTPVDTTPVDTTPVDTTPVDTTPVDTTPVEIPNIVDDILSNNDLNTTDAPQNENYDNLSVNDVELGIKLNQMNLQCDSRTYVDDILYYDGMGPALLRLCDYKQAQQFIDSDILKNPNNIQALTDKGVLLSKLGYYDKAIELFDSALSINSKYIPAITNKANVLAYTGKINEAKSLWISTLTINPEYQISKINLEKSPHDNVVLPIIDNHESSQLNSIDYSDPTPSTVKVDNIDDNSDNNLILKSIGNVLNTIGTFLDIFH